MDIQRTYDAAKVKAILTHPDIYDRIAEDGTPTADEFEPILDDAVFLVGQIDDTPFACMIYHQINGVTWECHIQVVPSHREHAGRFLRLALDWAFQHLRCRKLVAQIPFLYPNVMRFGLRHGFEVEGINRQSYAKNGQLHDQWYLGLTEVAHGLHKRQSVES